MRFSVFYTILLLIDLVIVSQRPEWTTFEYVVKPSLMVSLGYYFYQKSQLNKGKQDYWVMSAIIFSLVGDVALMFSGGFLIGLGAFLIAHIFYIAAFSMDTEGWIFTKKDRLPAVILVLLYGIGLLTYLMPHLGEMTIPVIIYASTILIMLLTAINRLYSVKHESFMWVTLGATLFVLSDSCIALGRFAQVEWAGGILVMLTYGVGQYLIVEGYLKNR